MDFLKPELLGSLGPMGILAAIIFYFYQKESRRCEEQHKTNSERLERVVDNNTVALVKHGEAVNNLVKAQAERRRRYEEHQ